MSGPTPDGPDPRARARMPLIDQITSGAVDDEYAEVARRRPAPDAGGTGDAGPAGSRVRRPGVLAGVAVALFAVLVTVSFQQTRENEDVVDASRSTLEERIRARRAVVDDAQAQIARLRTENNATQATVEVLGEADDDATARLVRLRDTTGLAAVTGEGLQLVVGDNPDGLPQHRVYDEDLALLVNGLWQAGATAVAVNGIRLTALSGFRFSGQAIRLNEVGVSLSPPYTVQALGEVATLAADLLDTTTGLRFQARVEEFGFTLDMQNERTLTLPPAPDRVAQGLQVARPGTADPDDEAPTGKDAP